MPAAAFKRAHVLWLVFGGPESRLLHLDGEAAWPHAELARITTPELTAWRFLLPEDAAVSIDGDGATWRVSTAPAKVPPRELGLARGADGAITLEGAGRPAHLSDPETGDRLDLLLVGQPPARRSEGARFVDLEVLPALLGAAWRVLADGLQVTAGESGLRFERAGELRLALADQEQPAPPQPPPSPPATVEHEAAHPPTAAEPPAVRAEQGLRLAALAPEPESRLRQRRKLLAGLAGSKGSTVRFGLARLYLADALGAEALAVLDAGAAAPPDDRLTELALRAAALVLLDRPEPARALFERIGPSDDPELALWRAVAMPAAGLGELDRARQVWASYPPRLRFRLGLSIAGRLGELGRKDATLAVLDQLAALPLGNVERAELALAKGRALAAADDGPNAARAFKAAEDGTWTTRLSARFANLQTGAGPEPGARLTALQAERLLWRGHPAEARMLSALARQQWDQDDVLGALATWSAALARAGGPTADEWIITELRRTIAARLNRPDPGLDAVTLAALLGEPAAAAVPLEPEAALRIAERLAAGGLPGAADRLLAGRAAGSTSSSVTLARAGYRLADDDPAGALDLLAQLGQGVASEPEALRLKDLALAASSGEPSGPAEADGDAIDALLAAEMAGATAPEVERDLGDTLAALRQLIGAHKAG